MALTIEDLSGAIPGCCAAGSVGIDELDPGVRGRLRELLPETKSVLVTGHHVSESLEWAWFPFEHERNHVTCAADLHARSVMENVSSLLGGRGHRCAIVPYPGRCGIPFKPLAVKAGLGRPGDSFLVLHPAWGPWMHLRVLLTDAVLSIPGPAAGFGEICTHCGNCSASCPGKAIGEGTFDGEACYHAQIEQGKVLNVPGYLHKCEICPRSCPIGRPPDAIKVQCVVHRA